MKTYINNSFGIANLSYGHNTLSPKNNSARKNSPLQRTFGSPNSPNSVNRDIQINDFSQQSKKNDFSRYTPEMEEAKNVKSNASPAFGVNIKPDREYDLKQSDVMNPFHIIKNEEPDLQLDSELQRGILELKKEPPVINPRELFKLDHNKGYIYESERNKEIQDHAKDFFSQFIVEEHQLMDGKKIQLKKFIF